ncbi:MAG: DUF2891 domain-containing protein [Gemmatimonadota bacterium]
MSENHRMSPTRAAAPYAEKFAGLALSHVGREYPNKLDHIMLGADDVRGPRALHPVFYGSFDWHSCVHGYWTMARLLRRYPDIPQAAAIRALFDERLTADNIAVETTYAAHPSRASFERPYGWAWLLMLAAELRMQEGEEGKRWAATVAPLADVFVARFLAFLPKATYPIRVGTHFNSAFAVTLAHEYAHVTGHDTLRDALHDAAHRWFAHDIGCQAWEPGGDDFLSSALMEAECMRRLMDPDAFATWFDAFLPGIAHRRPASLFTPATVSDRSDGKIAHLDGLNLSRAWCWRMLARGWAAGDDRAGVVAETIARHLDASLPHVAGDYAGEHWLATFALLALDDGLS